MSQDPPTRRMCRECGMNVGPAHCVGLVFFSGCSYVRHCGAFGERALMVKDAGVVAGSENGLLQRVAKRPAFIPRPLADYKKIAQKVACEY